MHRKFTPANLNPEDGQPITVKPTENRGMEFIHKKARDHVMKMIQYKFEQGLGDTEIARLMDLPRTTVQSQLKPFKAILDRPEEVKAFRANEGRMQDALRLILVEKMYEKLDGLTAAELKKTDLSRLSWAYSSIYDKNRLQTGQSTENISLAEVVKRAHARPEPKAAVEVEVEAAEVVSE